MIQKNASIIMMTIAFIGQLFGQQWGIDPELAMNVADGGLNTNDWLSLGLFGLGAAKQINDDRKRR